MENPNTGALSGRLADLGMGKQEIMRLFRGFNSYAEAFRKESDLHEK
jgi:hypothetical protein